MKSVLLTAAIFYSIKEGIDKFRESLADGDSMLVAIGKGIADFAITLLTLPITLIKKLVGFIAGQTAPEGRTMGHAGAIVGGSEDTAEAKMKIMEECGITIAKSPSELGTTLFNKLSN